MIERARPGGHPNRCGICGTALPPGDAVHRRCVACAEEDAPDVPPTYRGEKPPDHGARVSRGIRLTILRRKQEALGS